jgi:hypothetical protein
MMPRLLIAAALLAGIPSLVEAQQAAPMAPGRQIELSFGGTFAAPSPAGSATASLLTPGGANLDVFDVESRYGFGYGAEAGLSFGLGSRVFVEAVGAWTRTTARTEISDDLESADALTLTETLSRVSAEGALRIQIGDGATSWFVRGSGGWMRELAGGNTLAEDGYIFSAGGGLRHWFRDAGAGALKRVGLRLEGRLVMRRRGIEFGSRDLRVAPVAAGSIIFGF